MNVKKQKEIAERLIKGVTWLEVHGTDGEVAQGIREEMANMARQLCPSSPTDPLFLQDLVSALSETLFTWLERSPEIWEESLLSDTLLPCAKELDAVLALCTEGNSPAAEMRRKEETQRKLTALHQASNTAYRYRVSIVVTCYNHLAYTKLAIDSILKYTDFSRGDVELIVLDNGSSDGTAEYLSSLDSSVRRMHFTRNVRPNMSYLWLIQGQYFVGFSNDAVATPHWLENLLTCIESAPDIAMVVPTCPDFSVSNFQGIAISYANEISQMDKMEAFAAAFNQSDPQKWEERVVLMPFVSIVRMDVFITPVVDIGYFKIDFIDDDMSTALRRSGWRMFLAKDTFLHHFGSVTLRHEQVQENSLFFMRKYYHDKWGVDAWNGRGISLLAENFIAERTAKQDDHLLLLDPKFGQMYFNICNVYRRQKLSLPKTDVILTDLRYLPDQAKSVAQIFTGKLLEDVLPKLKNSYDMIVSGSYFHEISLRDLEGVLFALTHLLQPGGMLVLPFKNPLAKDQLAALLTDPFTGMYAGDPLPSFMLPPEDIMRRLSDNPWVAENFHCRVNFVESNSSDAWSERFASFLEELGWNIADERKRYLFRDTFIVKLIRKNAPQK